MAKTIFAQNPEKYVSALAEALKSVPEFVVPEWAMYVKSGVSRERPPMSEDFWYVRAASVLRQLYIRGVVGVGKLRTRYGSRKDRGGKPDKFFKSGGKIIRVILQQAEAAGLVEKIMRMQHGRRLTQQGRDFLDSIDVEDGKQLAINSEDWIVKTVYGEQPVVEGEDKVEENEEVEKEVEEEVEKENVKVKDEEVEKDGK
ncbi:40S ribosomal protein S19 [Candidatus Pacearchaeota archaeon]|nr:40S ribosomal protein S19 [Candidatus Pacearchaeota archaeon]